MKKIFSSLSGKVILLVIILILPLNIIAIEASNQAITHLVKQARLSEQNLADAYMATLKVRMENAQSMLSNFYSEDEDCISMTIQTDRGYQYQSARQRFLAKLKRLAAVSEGGDGYYFYSGRVDDLFAYYKSGTQKEYHEKIRENLQDKVQDGSERGWNIYEWGDTRYLVLLVRLRDVVYGGWIDIGAMENTIENNMESNGTRVLICEKGEYTEENNMVMASSTYKNIMLYIGTDRKNILGGVDFFNWLLQTMAIVYLSLIPILYLSLNAMLLKPLRKMNDAHRRLQMGDTKYRLNENARSLEYREAYESFNQMADNLKQLRIESYEKEIARQKMELRNLQLQIRPHFLLNTFNLIFTLTQRGETESIQKIIIYLSKYFRYIFRSDKELELFSREQELIERYVQMASIRYGGRIRLICDIDPELSYVRIPPLLVHNFVENSVKHGLSQNGDILHISITGRYESGMVYFDISDDGNGMDLQTLEKERRLVTGESEKEKDGAHVGLVNAIKRLKYFYGENAHLKIDSIQGEMTQFRLEFPYNLEDNDEFIDCK